MKTIRNIAIASVLVLSAVGLSSCGKKKKAPAAPSGPGSFSITIGANNATSGITINQCNNGDYITCEIDLTFTGNDPIDAYNGGILLYPCQTGFVAAAYYLPFGFTPFTSINCPAGAQYTMTATCNAFGLNNQGASSLGNLLLTNPDALTGTCPGA